ncbi:MAG TPA: methyltransferase domain-containing protein [Burkholderiaceae bacterium]|nr:methyltransferase domain-containing protein [Burkholderiaceae bacterium]
MTIPGTQGYAEQAAELIPRYEAEAFEDKHNVELHLLPAPPARILDVGAGTGADAGWLAARGYTVVAVEPTAAMRDAAQGLHADAAIEWVDDSLPMLATVCARSARFDVVMLTAVWMHLDETERQTGMARLASLLEPTGVLILSLRHGPVPAGRRMFDVTAAETVALAERSGLACVLNVQTDSWQALNRAAGVTWTHLAFSRC